MKLIIGILAMLLPVLCCGQPGTVKALHVGDKIPPVICGNIINSDTQAVSLAAYKGKVIILDFWATWCSSCVIHLPLMDSLQKNFSGKLQCVLVSTATTGDTKEKIQSFLQKRAQAGNSLSLPVIIGDTLFTVLFPHRLLPHYVWINTSGTVAAITDEDALTAANVNTLYTEKRIALPVKQDVMDYNSRQQLLEDGNGGSGDMLVFRSTLTRYLEGLPSGARINDDGINKKITYLNMPILSLYQAALGFKGNRIMVITRDSSRYFITNQTRNAWHKNFYSYEYAMPLSTPPQKAVGAMVQDLNERLGLYGRMEIKRVPCYIVVKNGLVSKAQSLHTATNEVFTKPSSFSITNETLSSLLEQMNSQLSFLLPKPIFIDETGYTGKLSLVINAGIDNIPALKKELQSYGFDLIPATRELLMFVLSEIN